MKNKMIATLLGLAMVIGSLTACGNDEASASDAKESVSKEESKTEEKTESEEEQQEDVYYPAGGKFKPGDEIPVDYFAGTEIDMLWEIVSGEDALVDKPIFKLAEEATGIKVNIINIESGARDDVVATTLASDNRPDVYLGGTISEAILSSQREMFYDLSEEGLLETYAPNVVAGYDEMGNVWPSLTWSDGSIYSLAGGWGTSYNDTACGIFMINKVWLDNVGMDVPTTAEEVLEVFRAFRDQDANGNGDPNDEIPFGFREGGWGTGLYHLMDFFGLGVGPDPSLKQHCFQLKDGKVISTMDTENFRAFMEFTATLAEEGLMDVEGFSQNGEQYGAKRDGDLYGATFEWIPSGERQDVLVPLIFEGIEGVEPIISGYGINGATFRRDCFVIDAESDKVAAALHWWNWLSKDTTTRRIATHGEQGKGWDYNSDGTVYEVTDYTFVTSLGDEINYNEFWNGMSNNGPLLLPGDCDRVWEGVTDPHDGATYRDKMLQSVIPYIVKEIVPKKFTGAEAEEERAFLEPDLMAYIENFTTTNILDGLTDAEWEAHLDALEEYGYYEWLDWYQRYMDGEL